MGITGGPDAGAARGVWDLRELIRCFGDWAAGVCCCDSIGGSWRGSMEDWILDTCWSGGVLAAAAPLVTGEVGRSLGEDRAIAESGGGMEERSPPGVGMVERSGMFAEGVAMVARSGLFAEVCS